MRWIRTFVAVSVLCSISFAADEVRLMVAPFDGEDETSKNSGAVLAELLILTLRENARDAIIYDYERLLWSLERALLRYASLDNAHKASRLAETVGATHILTGTVKWTGGAVQVTYRLWRYGEGAEQIGETLRVEGKIEDVASRILRRVSSILKIELAKKELVLPVAPKNLLTYGKILVCRRDPEKYSEAVEAITVLRKGGEGGAAVRFHSGWLLLARALKAYNSGDTGKAAKLKGVAERVLRAAVGAGGPKTYIARAYNSLGLVAMDNREWAEAEQRFGQAIATDRNMADIHRNAAAVYRKLRRYEKAIKHLQSASSIAPKDPAIYNDLGCTFLDAACDLKERKEEKKAEKMLEEAKRAYKKALAIDGQMVEAAGGLALTLDLLQKKEEALKYYRLYEKLGGDDTDLLDRLDVLEQELKEPKK